MIQQQQFNDPTLYETIDIILSQLYTSTLIIGLSKSLFKTSLELSVTNSFSLFNGKLFRQIKELKMGLPLGLTFANTFVFYGEQVVR